MKYNPKHPSYASLLGIMLFDHTSLNIIFPVLTLLFFDAQSTVETNAPRKSSKLVLKSIAKDNRIEWRVNQFDKSQQTKQYRGLCLESLLSDVL